MLIFFNRSIASFAVEILDFKNIKQKQIFT